MSIHPITLTVSPGRTGTIFLYATFMENYREGCAITHELLHPMAGRPALFHRPLDDKTQAEILSEPITNDLIQLWRQQAETGPVIDFGWTMSQLVLPFHKVFGKQLRVLFLHRHPISVAASFKLMGSYKEYDHKNYALTPMHARVRFPQFAERWPRMSCFEKCLYRWLEVTACGLELASLIPAEQYMVAGFDEFVRDEKVLKSIARFCGLPELTRIQPSPRQNPLQTQSLETYPIGEEWRNYLHHPELLELANKLGYNMTEDYVDQLVRKYRRPPGVLSFLRSVSGFWKLKSRTGNLLRLLGLRRQHEVTHKIRRQLEGKV